MKVAFRVSVCLDDEKSTVEIRIVRRTLQLREALEVSAEDSSLCSTRPNGLPSVVRARVPVEVFPIRVRRVMTMPSVNQRLPHGIQRVGHRSSAEIQELDAVKRDEPGLEIDRVEQRACIRD